MVSYRAAAVWAWERQCPVSALHFALSAANKQRSRRALKVRITDPHDLVAICLSDVTRNSCPSLRFPGRGYAEPATWG
jgi:hypothetical protein